MLDSKFTTALDLQRPDIALDATLSALHGYWLMKRGARRMPARKNIDPTEIPTLLPHLVLFDLHDNRLRYRLTGSATVDLLGREPTGHFLDEILPVTRYQVATRTYEMAIRESRPVLSRSRFTTPQDATVMVTRLVLPLSNDDIRANMIIAGIAVERGNSNLKELLGPNTNVDPNVAIRFLDDPVAQS